MADYLLRNKFSSVAIILVLLIVLYPTNAENIKNNNDILISINENLNNVNSTNKGLGPFWFDKSYHITDSYPELISDFNVDAGYKRDAGDNLSYSLALFPGEDIDDWPGRGRTGQLNLTDTGDCFFFCACIGQNIVIEMTPPSGFNYDLILFDKIGLERTSSINSGDASELINFVADYTGKWYMRIYSVDSNDTGLYFFNISLVGQNDAGLGIDAGDNFIDATLIQDTGSFFGYLDKNDEEDWYKIFVEKGQKLDLSLYVENYAYLSDFDIYLYNPVGNLSYYQTNYYDDEILYLINETGFWRIKIKIFPGYNDIPKPTDWDYFTYGSGSYELYFDFASFVTDPPEPIIQPDITPIAQTFIVNNMPDSIKDDFGYLAAIPACNYIENSDRYISPIVYSDDKTITNYFGTVDDTTSYLVDDWNAYLNLNNKKAVNYYIPTDPVKASADIALNNWKSSDLAVVTVDGSSFQDNTIEVLNISKNLKRRVKTEIVPCTSWKIKEILDVDLYAMFIDQNTCAISVSIYGDDIPNVGIYNVCPSLTEIFPKYMKHVSDWWPAHSDVPRNDLYYPITSPGLWGASVPIQLGNWYFEINKYEGHRYKIDVDDSNSILNVKIKMANPSDLIVFLIDPKGNIMAPDLPDWNGGEIKQIHEWNGLDDGSQLNSCDPYKSWIVESQTEFTAEVLHPDIGRWTAIVVPRYKEGLLSNNYEIIGELIKTSTKKADAIVSAANAAVIASLNHIPLLFVSENDVSSEIQNVISTLNVEKVIFVNRNGIGNKVVDKLPNIESNLTTMKEIIDYIKGYNNSENYITITSIKSKDGFFAPAAMLAAYHGSPVLLVDEIPGNPAGIANRIDTWCLWGGDYYQGNRAPGHLPIYDKPIEPISDYKLLIELIKNYISNGETGDLPPLGRDAKRYWNEEMHDSVYNYINSLGLDLSGQEAYAFVAPRKDIRLELHSVMIGSYSYAGQIPGDTPAYSSSVINRNILYPALIFANTNRDYTTTQFMNFPDTSTWITNDGKPHVVATSRDIKNIFMSHERKYEGHCLWDAHIKRLNDGCSVMYYSGHGTGGSGISAQYILSNYSNYQNQIWPDAWRGYMYDNWQTARDEGTRWYNPEPDNLYDFIHYKWMDQLFENLKSMACFYNSCSTGQHYGPLVYLDHGAVCWYGNAGSGLCPEGDLLDFWFLKDAMLNGEKIGQAYSKYVWLHYRDFTTKDSTSMYGFSTLYGEEGLTNVQCIYGDPNLIIYSPEWTLPVPVDSLIIS